MEYRLLGPVEARRDGEALNLGRKPRMLLALLLLNANQVVSTDRIIDELWGDDPGRDPQNALWVVISRLRSALEPDREKRSDGSILLTQMPGYRLAVDPNTIDATRFGHLVVEGRGVLDTDPEQAAGLLREALALWKGHALEEFTYEPFAAAEIARLEELRLATVEDRVEAELRLGHWRDLVGELEGRVHENPFRQRLVGQLMLAQHLSGRQSEALRTYGSLKTLLLEEQGLDPTADLVELEERILLDDPTLKPAAPSGPTGLGLSVRGYEIREQIGAGSMGQVYRAFQPAVGREVAIKVIHPELANDADFIRRFEVEAQAIAQLEHPQIVPVFDFWREPDSAYLVMRHFQHGTLSSAVEHEPLSVDRSLSILSQIGGALIAAHRRSATHGDLKPENVLLDGDGNAYLGDFGLSVSLPSGNDIEPPTELSDTKRFAALAEFILRNTVLDDHESPTPLQGDVVDVIGRARDDGAFTNVESFLHELTNALGSGIESASAAAAVNPYQGLRAFGEDDASRFHGRERLVDRLITRLGHVGPQGQFVALVGPSGSGKSSVVRAGVVPALREGAVLGSDRWFIVTMTPGPRPFESLAESLRSIAVNPPVDLAMQLESDGIAVVLERISPDPSAQVVVVVDQFEELFTQAEDADSFIGALVSVANDRHSGVKIIATMRADFYDRPLQHSELGELLRLGTEVITPMTPEELERAVTQPAHDVGVSFAPGAVARIAADMAGQSAALPLMQHALTELFDQRSDSVISAESYVELGGVSGALARRADALLDDLDPRGQQAARDVFLRLVTVQDGSADTRRRAGTAELRSIAGSEAAPLLESFGKHRLLSFDQDPVTRAPTAEIAHEALLTSWDRLRVWIDEARAALGAQRRLAESIEEWEHADEHADLVLTGTRLRPYDGWLEDPPVRLTERERSFLLASGEAEVSELAVERNRVSRLRRLVGLAAGAFVIAAIAAGVALWQQNSAAEAADVAEAQTIVAQEQTVLAEESAKTADVERMRAQATAEVGTNPPLAALLAVEAYNIDQSHLSAGAIQQVLTSVDGRRAILTDDNAEYGGTSVFLQEHNIVASSGRLAIDVWDITQESLILRIDEEFPNFDISDDARLIAYQAPGVDGMQLVDVGSADVLRSVPTWSCRDVAMSPDGNRLAVVRDSEEGFECGESPWWVEFWDISDPSSPALEHQTTVGDHRWIEWSPSADHYITMSGLGRVQYWDGSTHEEVWARDLGLPPANVAADVSGVLFRSDGNSVVVGVVTGGVGIGINLYSLDTTSGELIGEPLATAGLGSMNWFDEDETQLVGTFWPSGAAIFDMESGEEILPPPINNPNAAAVFNDYDRGQRVVSGFVGIEISSIDGSSVTERRIGLTPLQAEVKDQVSGQILASMTADGNRALMSIFDPTGQAPVVEWDLTTDPPTIISESGPGFALNVGEATLRFGAGPEGFNVTALDGAFEPLGPTFGLEQAERGPVSTWRASSDGSKQAAMRFGTSVYGIYDTASGERVREFDLPGADEGLTGVAGGDFGFSADGSHFVANWTIDDGPQIWVVFDTDSGEILHTGQGDQFDRPSVAGNTLYASSPDSFVLERYDITTLEEVGAPLVGHTLLLNAIRDDPSSDVIVSQASNGNVRVWDRETGDQIGREIAIGRQSAGTEIAVARNGELVGVILDREFAIWDYDLDSWPELACDIAGRNMTQQEWGDFGPTGEPYRLTCPDFAAG